MSACDNYAPPLHVFKPLETVATRFQFFEYLILENIAIFYSLKFNVAKIIAICRKCYWQGSSLHKIPVWNINTITWIYQQKI